MLCRSCGQSHLEELGCPLPGMDPDPVVVLAPTEPMFTDFAIERLQQENAELLAELVVFRKRDAHKKAYSKRYMKDYMRKRRANSG